MSIKRIKDLRDQRNTLAAEIRNVMEQNTGASWKPEHQAIYDAKMGDIERVDAEISRLQKLEDLNAEQSFQNMGGRTLPGPMGPATNSRDEQRQVFAKWLRGGDRALNDQDYAVIRNTTSTTTDTEGGYLVQHQEVQAELIRAMKEFGGMREVSTQFTTSAGGSLSWPTSDDTSNKGERVAENVSATDQDPNFGAIAMNAYKYSSKVVTLPIELVQDSLIDVESLVVEMLAERLARIHNEDFTLGTGTQQPRGIVTAASLGKAGATGQTTTVIYDDLVDLEHSIDPAYRKQGGFAWMMHDSSVKVIRKIKDLDGRPIFVPGYEVGSPSGAPSTLMGYPIRVNQDIAQMAANAKSILLGKLNNYRIRDVMGLTLFRFTDSAYAKKGQVGYLAWNRAGGNLIDLSGATVKYYQNPAS